jgi:5-(carboxyamino)imidazole ribonucleotide mutase
MPLVAQEAAQNVGFPSSALRFCVVEKNRLVAVSSGAVRAARHLSEVEGLLKASGSSAPPETCSDVDKPGIDTRTVAILVGGHSDISVIKNSGMMSILEELGIAYELSIISSEQNPEELRSYCLAVLSKTARLCICIAGLVPGLPAVVKAHLPMLPVISVPISLPGVDARDILLASFSLPRRRPVVIAGINETGLKKAAHLACELLASSSPAFRERYQRYIAESTPLPEYDVSLDEGETISSRDVIMSPVDSVILSTNGVHKGKQQ